MGNTVAELAQGNCSGALSRKKSTKILPKGIPETFPDTGGVAFSSWGSDECLVDDWRG